MPREFLGQQLSIVNVPVLCPASAEELLRDMWGLLHCWQKCSGLCAEVWLWKHVFFSILGRSGSLCWVSRFCHRESDQLLTVSPARLSLALPAASQGWRAFTFCSPHLSSPLLWQNLLDIFYKWAGFWSLIPARLSKSHFRIILQFLNTGSSMLFS